ncbi:unnamed protein product, partial [Haemonchus placei]
MKFTDYYGGEIKTSRLSEPGKGWKYEGKWVPDTHNNYGDKSGWVYSITEVFWGEPGTVDIERRADHKYRRRCIKRTRKAIDFKYQNFETYQSSLGDTKWEIFLGRFEVNPTVICTSTDSRAKPKWNTLTFQLGKSRGAVLACFELFCQDESTKNSLPLLPTRKSVDDRFEVPGELRPKFQNFAIQVLCWGVRNLKKYQFLSVRKPFLELIIGDMDTRTDPLPNVAKDPNFETPLITFPMVSLPSDLEFSPPLVINLYDTRAFKRQPLVGVCHITNFSRYTRFQSKKKEVSDKNDWSKYDSTVDTEDTELASTPVIASLSKEGKPA